MTSNIRSYLLTYLTVIKCFLVVECKMKLLPRYVGILKHHLVNKLEIKQCTSVLFEVLKSLYVNQQAVCTVCIVMVHHFCHCWRCPLSLLLLL